MKKIVILLFSILLIFIGINLYEFEKKVEYNQVLEIKTKKPLKYSLRELKGSDKIFFKLYLKMRNGGRNIKAGYYELNGKYNTREIISILESGKSKMYKFTIIEGSTVSNIFDKLVSEKKLNRDKLKDALKKIKF
nr:endolytic transglycosylase MltG [Fusobacterium sp.]